MARKAERISVSPEVMKWLRESSGYSLKSIAKRVKVSPERVLKWESGEADPTLRMLEELSKFYKRPLAAFMLPEPSPQPELPEDFRNLANSVDKPIYPKTRLGIRRARWMLLKAHDMIEDLEEEFKPLSRGISLNDNPETMAQKERMQLGIDLSDQISWISSRYFAFDQWRTAFEKQHIFVFQISMPLEDARGFCITDKGLPAIVVNSSDSVNARIFTLFHEYAHLLLHRTGICDLAVTNYGTSDAENVEWFCNRFAAEFLVPKEHFLSEQIVKHAAMSYQLDDHTLSKIANIYKVSKEVVVLRMLRLELITQGQYEDWKAERPQVKKKDRGGGIPQARKCLAEKGREFVSLVLESRDKGLISQRDITSYLSVKLENINKLESLVRH